MEKSEYQKKLETLSRETTQLIADTAFTTESTVMMVYFIVMYSKNEQEVYKRLKKLKDYDLKRMATMEELTDYMREALLKVLGAMDMEMPNKVLIAWKLNKDDKIYQFLLWLRDNVPENQVNKRQKEIVRKAVELSREDKGE